MDGFKKQPRPSKPIPQESPENYSVEPSSVSVDVDDRDTASRVSHEMESPQLAHGQPAPKKKRVKILIAVIFLFLLVFTASVIWFYSQLRPVDEQSDESIQFVISEGETFRDISRRLKERGLIRNELIFGLEARLSKQQSGIQAGTCKLTRALSADEILDKLTTGCQDFKSITFYPGATIEKPFYKSPSATLSQTLYVKNVLKEAGYTEVEIERGLSADYNSPLFAGKPESATLEGYIFGETYYVDTDASVESVLEVTFDEMYQVVKDRNLIQAYKEQGLETLYEGITMASIVQRELNCEDKPTAERKDRCYQYQRQIAQVLLKRLSEGIPLGADVTFIYAADMAGEQPTIDFDSPYNTRINTGLPPGPIGTPGELALRAVANPTDTDYLYFVAGDDGLIYFSKTQAEHDRNTREHCQQLCFELN